MPLNGSGSYAAPASSWNPAVTNTAVNSTDWAALLADLTTALSTALYKDGQQTPTANLPMGGFKLTSLAAGNAAGNSLRYEQLFSTSAVALLGAMDWFKGADIASAATVNLTTATGNALHVTGAVAITAVTLGSGMWRMVIFDGALTLTHHATNNNLPSGANITTAANDRALYWSDGTTVYCMAYVKANGRPVLVAAGDFATQSANAVLAGPTSGGAATPTFRALVNADVAGLGIVEGTAVATTSGTTASFTGLPTGIKKIVFMLKGVSTNSTSTLILQLSTSATFKVTLYNGGAVASGGSSTAVGGVGFPISVSAVAADTYKGQIILTRESASGFTWVMSGMVYMESGVNTPADFYTSAGEVSLAGTLDGIRLTTVSGDTFDAGEVNIQYE